ncbi:PASTA domain-containing protein [Nocardioides sp. AE5]|uniref:PASTA domain-containing protein n=1 Tax=Nocardioides sp. AE5 TaxID=2962573 RepID=UPI00288181F0|nr:PASTA domain-containing protein [Nocardioides sp. AE5]MDT0201569.1 PASTA domain-containing protein [Nocardioides sp. AE5]
MSGRSGRRLWWLILAGALVLVLVTAIGIAYGAGWGAANRAGNATRAHDVPAERVISIPDFGQAGGTEMPDVRGLTLEEARQALGDAQITARITTQERPAAGRSGVVIQQSPIFGAANPAAVLLVIAQEAKVPDVIGTPIQDAIDAMQGMGARVQQVKVYRPGATVGNVVATSPKAGEGLTEMVTLQVADAPSERRLVDLSTLQGYPSADSDTVAIHGVSYGSAMYFSPSHDDPADLVWNLGGADLYLSAQFVLGEDAEAGERGRIEVRGDGELIDSFEVTSTKAAKLETSLAGVQTLMIRVVNTVDPESSDDPPWRANVVLLNPVLLGSYEQIQRLPQ